MKNYSSFSKMSTKMFVNWDMQFYHGILRVPRKSAAAAWNIMSSYK